MKTSLVIMGAAGRMGSTLVRLTLQAEDLKLHAVVEPHQENLPPLPADCLVAKSLDEIAEKCQGCVIIDFTAPHVSMNIAKLAAKHKMAHVIGTTGINAEEKDELCTLAKETPILLSPNMSVGVNVLLDILPKLTAMLGDEYDTDLMEIHHNLKKDSPSGTALRLAEAVAEGKNKNLADVACYHREGLIGERPKDEIGIQTLRGGDVVGVHTIYYMGAGERIEVTHHAHSRENFAAGALRAARWIQGQSAGELYSMRNVLAEKN